MSKRSHPSKLLAAAVLVGQLLLIDTTMAEPVPPCANAPLNPAYADAGPTPTVEVWYGDDFDKQWRPHQCLGWKPMKTAVVVAAAGRFHEAGGVAAIVSRFAKVSQLTKMKYWSVTRQAWRQLVPEAYALSGPGRALRRGDFSARELTAGARFHYWQTENSPAGDVVYRAEVRARDAGRLTLAFENATPVRYFLLPLFEPGEYQFIYFLQRENDDLWRFYSVLRTAASFGISGRDHEASFINRAVAIFRYVAGFKGEIAPPAAPVNTKDVR